MSDVTVQVRGIEALQKFLSELPKGSKIAAIKAATEYLIGNDSHGLKHLVAYNYVSRTAAYGQPFVSDRQRAYVMAMIHEGKITPGTENRTGALVEGWKYTTSNSGYSARIYNDVKGDPYVQGDESQARQPAMVGHRKMSDVISTNIDGAMQAVKQAIQQWINLNSGSGAFGGPTGWTRIV